MMAPLQKLNQRFITFDLKVKGGAVSRPHHKGGKGVLTFRVEDINFQRRGN